MGDQPTQTDTNGVVDRGVADSVAVLLRWGVNPDTIRRMPADLLKAAAGRHREPRGGPWDVIPHNTRTGDNE